MTETRIKLENGTEIKVELFDSLCDYLECPCFGHYYDIYFEKIPEEERNEYIVREVLMFDDHKFITSPDDDDIPETLELDSVKYRYVNYGEDEISYLRSDASDSVWAVIRMINFKYRWDTAVIFDTEENAQEYAIEKNMKMISINNGVTYLPYNEAVEQLREESGWSDDIIWETIFHYADNDQLREISDEIGECEEIDLLVAYLKRAKYDIVIG